MRVFTNGCFDVLHIGHIELLKYCATLGNVIVGLNGDDSVRRLKGPSRPFNGEQARAKILESIDEENSLTRFYNKSILDPFASVFNTDINEAKKIASVIDLNGSEFSVEELNAVDKDILKLALSNESLDIIGINTDSFDALKIANISEEDKVNLALYL